MPLSATLLPFALAASLLMAGSAQANTMADIPPPDGLFGTVEIPSRDLQALPQWTRVIGDFKKSDRAARLCDQDIQKCASQQMTLWRAKIQELTEAERSTQLREINRFINKWRHVSDMENYGHADYWASPLEFITNGGDSEDFAIMKYISLKELGVPVANMRIVVTSDVLRGQNHTILYVRENGRRLVLDSQNDTVQQEKNVKYYVPFYSVNETTRWAHVANEATEIAGATEKPRDD
ncbi:hypothetical protein GCM10007924_14090 [Sneathiella chinensis]|uniref:Transglutaminase n=2 Tax=Sneathiella chinensis TaxID=349750 RepID=A0ABQ5U2Z5_9PROT|nr:hypothetical protein GCM10007924_14090 [Sneathiella chinensis]